MARRGFRGRINQRRGDRQGGRYSDVELDAFTGGEPVSLGPEEILDMRNRGEITEEQALELLAEFEKTGNPLVIDEPLDDLVIDEVTDPPAELEQYVPAPTPSPLDTEAEVRGRDAIDLASFAADHRRDLGLPFDYTLFPPQSLPIGERAPNLDPIDAFLATQAGAGPRRDDMPKSGYEQWAGEDTEKRGISQDAYGTDPGFGSGARSLAPMRPDATHPGLRTSGRLVKQPLPIDTNAQAVSAGQLLRQRYKDLGGLEENLPPEPQRDPFEPPAGSRPAVQAEIDEFLNTEMPARELDYQLKKLELDQKSWQKIIDYEKAVRGRMPGAMEQRQTPQGVARNQALAGEVAARAAQPDMGTGESQRALSERFLSDEAAQRRGHGYRTLPGGQVIITSPPRPAVSPEDEARQQAAIKKLEEGGYSKKRDDTLRATLAVSPSPYEPKRIRGPGAGAVPR